MIKTLLAATATLTLLAPATLASDANRQSETVVFDATDLHNPNAVAEIRAELLDAAEKLCVERGLRGLDRARVEQQCIEATFAAADFRLEQRLADASNGSSRFAMTLVRSE
ncbi:UrcA family protein [Maricaulis parjimensis]|uniref:UrcA family protein n=1 Tax=Maricaulis parjimensis TaxID=144023 RepID=UPI001939AF28|nr:UrcA family protein [Maricaulis parjimensis]